MKIHTDWEIPDPPKNSSGLYWHELITDFLGASFWLSVSGYGLYKLAEKFWGPFIFLLAFNWLAPLDEHCLGPLDYNTFEPSYECYKIDNGIEPWEVRAA